jgi:hypothetical protein
MLTEDYIMRMINQALAALLKLIGLKRAGQYAAARQMIDQSLELLLGVRADLARQLDDPGLLALLTMGGELDLARAAVVADLFKEDGDIQAAQGQPGESRLAYLRALNFYLEVALRDFDHLEAVFINKIEALYVNLKKDPLPVETQLALLDYYEGLMEKDEALLLSGGTSWRGAEIEADYLRAQLGPLLA